MESFTFGLLLFNHEQIVIEALESIKYQILNYGKGKNVSLVVIDDCSKDRSPIIVKKWINDNSTIFYSTNLIINNSNEGTVKCYNKLLDVIHDNYFKIIAADDVFSSVNIFAKNHTISDNELYCFQMLKLCDKQVFLDYDYVKNRYVNSNYKNKKDALKKLRRGGFIHTPSTIYTKNLYINSEAKKLNSNFVLFEDDPTWYSMIKYGATIRFDNDVIVLYRIHKQSVSNSTLSEGHRVFKNDMVNLQKFYQSETYGLEKIFIMSKAYDKLPKIFKLYKYRDKFIRLCNSFLAMRSDVYRKEIIVLENKMREQQIYYNEIYRVSNEYYNKVVDQLDA